MSIKFNIADMFEVVADQVPERDALVCGEQRASYRGLDERANRLAHYLASQGVGAGDNVGLYMYNCNEFIEGMLACFKIRAVRSEEAVNRRSPEGSHAALRTCPP